jgi:periplasmic protein TonB
MTAFLGNPSPRMPAHHGILGSLRYGAISLTAHATVLTALIALGVERPDPRLTQTRVVSVTPIHAKLVFLETARQEELAQGGGGGGDKKPGPIRNAQAPGTDSLTLLVAQPIVASAQPLDEPAPQQVVLLAAKRLTSGLAFQVGSINGVPPGTSQGPGDGGGAGDGTGLGDGPGRGDGLGPGSGGNTGGGVYRIGNGVTPPALLYQVKPAYTPFALRAKIQGSVLLEAVVQRDGTTRDIRITRSLDPYGLDVEAIHALEQWLFRPGRFNGAPVDVRVLVQLDFNIQ